MELSDKQYIEIERYLEGEMEVSEKEAFEADLLQDSELAEEVEAYKEILSLANSTKEKISEAAQLSSEEKILDKKVWELLEKERKYWEMHHEPDLKRIHGLTGSAEPTITREERQGKLIRINRRKWLAAAVVIGLLGLGSLLWWYVQPERMKAEDALRTKKPDSGNIVNKNGNRQEDLTSKGSDLSSIANNTAADSAGKKQEAPKKRLDKEEQEQLYAQNFVLDAPPQQRTMLEDAFEHYEKGRYKQASIAYEEAQKQVESLTTRTLEDEEDEAEKKHILFYAHYYNALSYMAAGNAIKAISELKTIKESPDDYWSSKQQWYLALAYLKTGEIVKANTLLQQVARSKQAGEYGQKAIQLSKGLQEE